MMTLVYGGAGSGKSTLFYREIVRDLAEGRTPFLIVPEQQAIEAEQNLTRLCDAADVPTASLEILSFSRLANRIFRQYGGLSYRNLEKGARQLVMWRVLSDLREVLGEYRDISITDKSTIRLLSDTMTEFTRYKVTPAMLEKAASDLDETGVFSALRSRIADLSLLYAAYRTLLHRDYDDPEEELTRACTLLETRNFFDGVRLYVDSFTSFTPRQLDMLRCMMKQSEELKISIGCRPDESGLHSRSMLDTARTLLRMAADTGCGIGDRVVLETFVRSPHDDLRYLEANLWREGCAPYTDPAPHLHLLSCSDPFDEAECAAREILRHVREGGHYYEHLLVVRDPAGWEGVLDAVLEKYGIPYFLSVRTPLSTRPQIKLILTALAVVGGHWRLDDVIAHIKTGCTAISPEDCDRLERYASTWKICGRRWLEDDWEMNPDGYTDTLTEAGRETLEQVNAIRRTLTDPLRALGDTFSGGCSVRQGSEAVWRFLCEVGLDRRLSESGDPDGIQLWNLLMNALDQLVQAAPDTVVNASEFARLLSVILDETDMGSIPTAIDQVVVGSAMLLRAGRGRYVTLLGANEELFPAKIVDGGLFCDQDKVTLESLGIVLSPMTDNRYADELLYFYRAMCSAGESVTVSWSVLDHSGSALRPSAAVNRIRTLFPSLEVRSSTDFSLLERLEGEEASFELYAMLRGTPAGGAMEAYYCGREAYARRLEALGKPFVSAENLLSPEMAQALYGHNLSLTQAKLDAYSLCSFSYYCKYVLKLSESKPAEFRGVSTGSFVHKILERFMTEAVQRDFLRNRPDAALLEQTVNGIVYAYVMEIMGDEKQRTNRIMQLVGRLRRTTLLLVNNLLDEFSQSEFLPAFFELPIDFDDPNGVRPFRIPLPDGGQVYITGKIDRVDTLRKGGDVYVRVVDYKTGVQDFSLSDIELGLNLQMLLYLFALCQDPGRQFRQRTGCSGEVIPAGVLYFSARTPSLSLSDVRPEEEISELAGERLTRKGVLLRDEDVLRAMEKQLAGHFIPVTLKKDGDFSASAPLRSLEEFGTLLRQITGIVSDIALRMKSGRADAKPLRTPRHDACKFCPMKAVCRIAGS